MTPHPEFFYRYRSLSGSSAAGVEQSLRHSRHYFASPKAFNDPFDCRPYFSLQASSVQLTKYFEGALLRHAPELSRSARRAEARRRATATDCDPRLPGNMADFHRAYDQTVTDQIGVFCLSEVRDSLLMWAHYANSHRGICLQFKGEQLLGTAQPILYQRTRPTVNPIIHSREEMLDRALLTKSADWAYEREWRAFHYKSGAGLYDIPAPSLTGVILGSQISDADRESVLCWVQARQIPLKLYQATLSETEFRLRIDATPQPKA